jgi:hypothetical protein
MKATFTYIDATTKERRILMRLLITRTMLAALFVTGMALLPGCKESVDPASTNQYPNDVSEKVPPEGQGFLIVLGPFDAGSQTEFQRNFYQKLPNDSDAYIKFVQVESNDGCQYMDIFRSDVDVPDHTEDSWAPLDLNQWDLIASALRPKQVWSLTPGAGFHIKPHQQVNFRLGFVDPGAGSKNGKRGKVIINFWYLKPASQVVYKIGALYADNPAVKIPPHTSATFCKPFKPFNDSVQVMLMQGRYHSRGKKFLFGTWKNGKMDNVLYGMDSTISWKAPTVTEAACGLVIGRDDSLAIITTYENPTDKEITFGTQTESQEQAGFYMFFNPAPVNGKAVYDLGEGYLMESHQLK